MSEHATLVIWTAFWAVVALMVLLARALPL